MRRRRIFSILGNLQRFSCCTRAGYPGPPRGGGRAKADECSRGRADRQTEGLYALAAGPPAIPMARRSHLPCTPFIIFFICEYCLSRRLISCTEVPEPLAIRFLRLPLSTSGR